jgi:hypothetical protein
MRDDAMGFVFYGDHVEISTGRFMALVAPLMAMPRLY